MGSKSTLEKAYEMSGLVEGSPDCTCDAHNKGKNLETDLITGNSKVVCAACGRILRSYKGHAKKQTKKHDKV